MNWKQIVGIVFCAFIFAGCDQGNGPRTSSSHTGPRLTKEQQAWRITIPVPGKDKPVYRREGPPEIAVRVEEVGFKLLNVMTLGKYEVIVTWGAKATVTNLSVVPVHLEFTYQIEDDDKFPVTTKIFGTQDDRPFTVTTEKFRTQDRRVLPNQTRTFRTMDVFPYADADRATRASLGFRAWKAEKEEG